MLKLVKRIFPVVVIVAGAAFIVGGAYAYDQGSDAEAQIRDELVAQNIVTPDDASIPGVLVDSPATAQSMADIIDQHQREGADGKAYADLGRFKSAADPEDPAGTSVEEEALIGDNGRPVPNPAREIALTATTLRSSLLSAVMAFSVATLVQGLGFFALGVGVIVTGIGVALAGLAFPSLARRFRVQPAEVS